MIISHSRKFIFVHVPKTGGSSVTQMLLPYLDLSRDIVIGGDSSCEDGKDVERNRQNKIHKHSTAEEIKDFVGEEIWNQYFVFAFTRDPFSRAVSLYEWWHQTPWKGDQQRKKKIMDMSFEEFLNCHEDEEINGKPMIHYLTSKQEKDFHSDYAFNIKVDYLGRLEDIWGGCAYIFGRLGLPHVHVIEANKTKKRKKIEEYYNPKSASRLRQLYLEDFKTFNYDMRVDLF